MVASISTHLMFDGTAEEAMNSYVSLFQGAAINEIERYESGEQGIEGTVKRAAFSLGEQRFICIDSPVKHDFGFTPSISIFVDCESQTEIEGACQGLATGGQILMPLDNYGFSRCYSWIQDRFGVSWQLNLP